MTTQNRQIGSEQKPSEPPSDDELFTAEVHDHLSEREIFAGDEDFFEQLVDSDQTAAAGEPTVTSPFLPVPLKHKRFSTTQKVLLIGIVMTAAMLSYALFRSSSEFGSRRTPTSVYQKELWSRRKFPIEPQEESAGRLAQQKIQKQEPAVAATPALSLKVAETLYQEGDYNRAFAAYSQLQQSLPTSPEEQLIGDFLQLRMALCAKKASDLDQAGRLFRSVLQSRSPIVRAVANYHLSLLEIQKKQYLKAQTRAYQAIAFVDAADSDGDWIAAITSDCHFLVAESVTRNVLSLCDADKDCPPELWSSGVGVDPFINRTEAELRPFLSSGIEQLSKSLLGPQVQQIISPETSGPACWSVICQGAPIEEVLTRFAANAGIDVHWASGANPVVIRERPVSLFLPATTTQQCVKVAAGCAGLLARPGENGVVNIFNPADYSSLSQHVSLLSDEAVSLWQRFLLTFYDDKRIPNAHFALGLLQAQKGRVSDAMAEYKLVANRFSRTSLAPFALLHLSKLKTNLHDYLGARDELEQLLEGYPDTEIANQACLDLADLTMKAGLTTEAARLYRKVYNLGFSFRSRTCAALRAGSCLYQMEDFQSATKWLTRYIDLTKDHPSTDLYSACFLLGKSNLALGDTQQACEAFQYALTGQLFKEEYVETVSSLVRSHLKLGNFIEALDVLENIESWRLSEKDSVEMLLLKSEVLRAMGLVDKAIVALRDRAEYISDRQIGTKVSFELAKCHIAGGNLQFARNSLAEILINVDPGPFAHEIAFELANVCLELGQSSQTVSVCLQILNSGPSEHIQPEALKILAAAYNQQRSYDKAALALCGRWNETETPSEKGMFDGHSATVLLQEPNNIGRPTNENRQ